MRPWIEPPETPVPADLLDLAEGDLLSAQALVRRGYGDVVAARAFLDPQYYHPASPAEFPGMDRAVERLLKCLRDRERILVWGDFDVDGQTATSLLVATLRELSAQVSYHIPIRAQESHGVDLRVLKRLLESSGSLPSLVLTCDTGIAAYPAVDYARSRGVDVIITDHHELPVSPPGAGNAQGRDPGSLLPQAYAIITPRMLPRDHPMSSLPGVGVAYKLAEALYSATGDPERVSQHQDLAALGIVADVALQIGDARYLLQRGLAQLRKPQRAGLQAIYERAEQNPEQLTEEQIGFVIAPRLNALGRLSDANPAVELLTTNDLGRARLLALELEGLNARRQLLTSQVLRAALAQIESRPEYRTESVLVLSHPSWPAGVIGIVASRLVELFGKPAVLISAPAGDLGRGSARSVDGVDITAAIAAQAGLLHSFGGHTMAAGFAIEQENIPIFRSRLGENVAAQLAAASYEPAALKIDGYLDWGVLDLPLAASLDRLAPFGPGNPPFVLASRGLQLVSQTTFGRQNEHMQLIVEDANGLARRVVWWGAGELDQLDLLPQGRFDLAYKIKPTSFRGQPELSITYEDTRFEAGEIELEPQRIAPEILDQRLEARPLRILISLLKGKNPGQIKVWAEGDESVRLKDGLAKAGLDDFQGSLAPRERIEACDTLIIWTAPPGSIVLGEILRLAQPALLVVFALDPRSDHPQAFLQRLAGLVKYSIAHNADPLDLTRLASATAQHEVTVQLGLDWLAAMGMEPPGEKNPGSASILLDQIKGLLEETHAYRDYFRRMDLSQLEISSGNRQDTQ